MNSINSVLQTIIEENETTEKNGKINQTSYNYKHTSDLKRKIYMDNMFMANIVSNKKKIKM